VPLKQGTKEHLYSEAKAMRLKSEELRKDLGNGSNIGLYPGGDLVAIVAFPAQLKKALEEAIEKEGALALDNDCHPAMRDLNLTGMHVDRAKLEAMYHIAKRTLEDAREKVIQLLGNCDPKWNPDSNSDLREGLARKGISVSATNKELSVLSTGARKSSLYGDTDGQNRPTSRR
jgi:hypothetical protein